VIEIEILVTGIAGQGIQLATRTLALAAAREGREVMLCPEYGGSMRGGSSLAQLAVGDGPIRALPVFHRADFAIALHDQFFLIADERLRRGADVLVNSALVTRAIADHRTFAVAATEIAESVGSPQAAALVACAAFARGTNLVATESLVEAVAELLPPYRSQHREANERAIRTGAEQAPSMRDVWAVDAVGAVR